MSDAMTWQPIETAPKDGTRVLASIPRIGIDWVRWGAWAEENGEKREFAWWYEEDCPVKPTHWMPLPKPPEPA